MVDVCLQAERDGAAAERFLAARAAVSNPCNLGSHPVRAEQYKNLRTSAFSEWRRAIG